MNIVAYAELNGSVVIDYPVYQGDIQNAYPDTSFPTPFIPPEGYVAVYETPQPSYDWITQNINEGTPVQIDGAWLQVWIVSEATQEQVDERQAAAKHQNKQKASQLLSATDWTATVDINNPQYSNPYLGNQDAFLTYRSQVRAIAVNPQVVVESWPVKPDEVWESVIPVMENLAADEVV